MKTPRPEESGAIIAANILADRVQRAAAWCAWLAIMAGLVVPLAWNAWRERGIVAGLVVLALCAALAWHVKPAGRSYAAQCRDIDARFPLE